jgi:hydroxymethylglutaryl-CoA reductase
MKRILLAAMLLSPLPAIADDTTEYLMPVIPTEAAKVAALKRAYQLNNNSMTGFGSIDLAETPGTVRTIKIAPDELPPAVTAAAKEKPIKVAEALPIEQNVCTKHGKRKVMRNGGKSWKCK